MDDFQKNNKKEWNEKNKEKIKEYKKQWYRNNKEKIKKCKKEWNEKNKEKIKEYKKQWYQNNIKELNEYKKQWYQTNKEKIKQKRKKYYKNNKEKVLESQKKYRAKNKEKYKKYIRDYRFSRRKKDLNFRILDTLRSRINKFVFKNKNNLSSLKLTGCSINDLKIHLEKKFKKGMTWENYGRMGWHIDHIIPCSSFNLVNIEEQKKCFHYTNLQPLWWWENLSKGNKKPHKN